MLEKDTNLVEFLELVCFRGKTHLKRGSGFTHLSNSFLWKRYLYYENEETRNYETADELESRIKQLFL
jgi:hypothetical protein